MLYRPYDPYAGPLNPGSPLTMSNENIQGGTQGMSVGQMAMGAGVVLGGVAAGGWLLSKTGGKGALRQGAGAVAEGAKSLGHAVAAGQKAQALSILGSGMVETARLAGKGTVLSLQGVAEAGHYWLRGHKGWTMSTSTVESVAGGGRNVVFGTKIIDPAMKTGFKNATGFLGPGALLTEAAMVGGIVAYEAIRHDIPPAPNLALQVRGSATSLAGGFGGALAGAAIMSWLPGVGSLVGGMAGAIGGYMFGTSKMGDRFFGNPLAGAMESAARAKEGYGPRNPFLPNAHGFHHNNRTLTMRQSSLEAIHKSPLNDRARLLGREAMYMHM